MEYRSQALTPLARAENSRGHRDRSFYSRAESAPRASPEPGAHRTESNALAVNASPELETLGAVTRFRAVLMDGHDHALREAPTRNGADFNLEMGLASAYNTRILNLPV